MGTHDWSTDVSGPPSALDVLRKPLAQIRQDIEVIVDKMPPEKAAGYLIACDAHDAALASLEQLVEAAQAIVISDGTRAEAFRAALAAVGPGEETAE